MLQNSLRIDLRHYQRYLRVHTKSTGIINDHRAGFHSMRSEIFRNGTACKQSDIHTFKGIESSFFNSVGFTHKSYFFTGAAFRSQQA